MRRLIALAAVCVTLAPALASGQTLGDVAKAEEARRKTVQKGGKVYTNGDLKPDRVAPPSTVAQEPTASTAPAAPVTPPESASGAPAAAVGGGAAAAPAPGAAPARRDQPYWSARIGAAREQLERSRTFADALQSRINALTTDFVNRDDPAQRDIIGQDRTKAIAELERVKKDIDEQTKAIAAIEDEARRAGVPPGWLR